MRTALPWILLSLVTGGWIGATFLERDEVAPTPEVAPASATDDIATLRAAVQSLRAEVRALREERRSAGPVLEAKGTKPSTRPRAVKPRSEEFKQREENRRRQETLRAKRKAWWDAIRSLKDNEARATAIAEVRAAFDGDDDMLRLNALQLARWLGKLDYDRDDWRAAILPHVQSEDRMTRTAALIALAYVKPEASDINHWPDVAKDSDRNNAEEMAHAITRTADGILRDEAATAVLHLLRPGTNIKKAFVIRGLQSVKEWDPAVEARLVEIVGKAPAHDYDSGYFFHFVTPRMDPKSDAILELMLKKIEAGRSSIQTLSRGFRKGLDERQKSHAADKLLDYAENADNAYTVRWLAEALQFVASMRHVDRMAALVSGDDVDQHAKSAMERAMQAARTRR
ncbi:MAG: hypothetical protein QNJ90_10450 [Planctomycetota bacterium]|nr:hypothetical protein [Planctomycetota bacterium]